MPTSLPPPNSRKTSSRAFQLTYHLNSGPGAVPLAGEGPGRGRAARLSSHTLRPHLLCDTQGSLREKRGFRSLPYRDAAILSALPSSNSLHLNSGPGALPLAGEGPGRGRAAPFLAKPHPFPRASRLALDASAGNRRFDENGFLHVAVSHISKEAVNPYYGHEIPGWETLGLDPERIYHGWRAGAELAAGAATFNGLPLLLDHYVDSASDPQKEHRVGSLGTDAAFRTPYLDNSLIVTDATAIAAIASGAARELSAAYMYDPVFAPGRFNGQTYDFVMTNIRGNHVALVEEGRAGHDVVVADARINPQLKRNKLMGIINRFKTLARDSSLPGTAPDPAGPPPIADEDFFAATVAGCDDPAVLDNDLGLPALSGLSGDELEYAALDDDLGDFAARLDELLVEIPDQNTAAALRVLILAARSNVNPLLAGDDNEDDLMLSGDEDLVLADGEATNTAAGGASIPTAQDRRPAGPLNRDAALRRAKRGLTRHFCALNEAARAVRPLIGDVDPLAFDSATGIYKKALALSGITPDQYPASAWRGMCEVLKNARPGSLPPAMDRQRASRLDGPFKNLTTIRVEG